MEQVVGQITAVVLAEDAVESFWIDRQTIDRTVPFLALNRVREDTWVLYDEAMQPALVVEGERDVNTVVASLFLFPGNIFRRIVL